MVGVAALLLLAGLVAAVVVDGPSPSATRVAAELLRDDARFGTTAEAASTFLRVSEELAAEAERCEAGDGRSDRDRCRRYFASAAYARVAAVGLVKCSRPEVFAARADMLDHVEALAADPADAAVPPPPRCG